jgi:lysozyme family protein
MSVDTIIDGVVSRESEKYTNSVEDAGGPTKYGITLRTLTKFRRFPATAADVQALTRPEAVTIYRWAFVEAPGFDKLLIINKAIAEKLIDQGVLCGPPRASEWLQRALNAFNRQAKDYPDVKVDGDAGPATQRALVSFLHVRGREGVTVLMEALQALQGAYLIDLAERRPTDEAFIFGWFRNRVAFAPVPSFAPGVI